jgi:hypothetical protein
VNLVKTLVRGQVSSAALLHRQRNGTDVPASLRLQTFSQQSSSKHDARCGEDQ